MRNVLRGFALTAAALVLLASVPTAARADETLQSASISTACATSTGCASTAVLKTIARQYANAQIQVSGCPSSSYAMVLEYSLDGVAYSTVNVYNDGTQTSNGSIGSAGVYDSAVPVYSYVQVRASSFSGSACNVTLHLVPAVSTFTVAASRDRFTRYGLLASVAADGSASSSISFAVPFQASVSSIVVSPNAYSGVDNAVIMCRTSSVTVNGCTVICGGGVAGSTVGVYYVAKGV